jgi:hypothetical protein
MRSSRFTVPDASNDGQPNSHLMLKWEHDPSELILLDPPPSKLLFCLSQVAASLHPSSVEMIEHALKSDLPLDVETLSRGTDYSRAVLEERTTLRVNEKQPEYTRAVVISRLRPPEGPMSEHNDEDHRDLALHITQSVPGKIEAILTWEQEDLSTNLNMLRERWERFDKLFKDMGLPPPPIDIGPFAQDPSGQDPSPMFDYENTTLAAYVTPADVILTYDDSAESQRAHADNDADDDDDGFTSAGDEFDDERESDSNLAEHDETSTDEEEGETPHLGAPTDELIIINPSAAQLAKIAKLSGMPAKVSVIEHVMSATRAGEDLTPENFSKLSPGDYSQLVISAKRTFELAGGLRRGHSMTIGDSTERDGVGFSITLTNVDQTGVQQNSPLKAVLKWEMFAIDAHVKNWETILKIAGGNGARG